ncbi:HutD family protein [Paracoccus salipaludis]|uniref:HutD-family protein n=1 Tax=Paracoccus salipaludis TaxID=2032623 RepID=A0A2A2GMP5_9RHOB|nr:HutD family protein [Paracoccus salipaludis]PAU98781.1 HutD-family protein [Paracoccus salipaludis]
MRLLRRGEGRASRWKNGGGVTHELAVWPDGADLSGFDARLSMAEVAADGPFSAFPGIDRTLAVLDGGPMRLSFGGAEVAVTANGPPLSFPGEAPVRAALDQGPVLDLNIMTRRGAFSHRMVELSPGDSLPEGTVALVARGGVSVAGLDLAAGDALLGGKSASLQGRVDRGRPLAVILDCLKNRQEARS